MGIRERLKTLSKRTLKLRESVGRIDTSLTSSYLYSNLQSSLKKVDAEIRKASQKRINLSESLKQTNSSKNIVVPPLGEIEKERISSKVSSVFSVKTPEVEMYKQESNVLRSQALSSINLYRSIAYGNDDVAVDLRQKQSVLRALFTTKSILERMLRNTAGDPEKESVLISKIQEINKEIAEAQREIDRVSKESGVDPLEIERSILLGDIFQYMMKAEALEFESIRAAQIALSEVVSTYPSLCEEMGDTVNLATGQIIEAIHAVAVSNANNIREVHSYIGQRMEDLNGLITGYGTIGRDDILKMNQTLEKSQSAILVHIKDTQDKLVALSSAQAQTEIDVLNTLIESESKRIKREQDREEEEAGFLGSLGSNPILAPFIWLLKNVPKFIVFFVIGALILIPVFLWLIDVAIAKLQTMILRALDVGSKQILKALETFGRIFDPKLELLKEGELEESVNALSKPIEVPEEKTPLRGIFEKGKGFVGGMIDEVKSTFQQKFGTNDNNDKKPEGGKTPNAPTVGTQPTESALTPNKEKSAEGVKQKEGATVSPVVNALNSVSSFTNSWSEISPFKKNSKESKKGSKAKGEGKPKGKNNKDKEVLNFLVKIDKKEGGEILEQYLTEDVLNVSSPLDQAYIIYYAKHGLKEELNKKLSEIENKYTVSDDDAVKNTTSSVEEGKTQPYVTSSSPTLVANDNGSEVSLTTSLVVEELSNPNVVNNVKNISQVENVEVDDGVVVVVPSDITEEMPVVTENEIDTQSIANKKPNGNVHIVHGGVDKYVIESTTVVNVGDRNKYNGDTVSKIV